MSSEATYPVIQIIDGDKQYVRPLRSRTPGRGRPSSEEGKDEESLSDHAVVSHLFEKVPIFESPAAFGDTR